MELPTLLGAVDDDRIYATTLNYDIWEYPVLLEDEVVVHVIATDPSVTRDRWFDSKTIVAQNYRPYHEVGNLLSYRDEIPPETSDEFIPPLESEFIGVHFLFPDPIVGNQLPRRSEASRAASLLPLPDAIGSHLVE